MQIVHKYLGITHYASPSLPHFPIMYRHVFNTDLNFTAWNLLLPDITYQSQAPEPPPVPSFVSWSFSLSPLALSHCLLSSSTLSLDRPIFYLHTTSVPCPHPLFLRRCLKGEKKLQLKGVCKILHTSGLRFTVCLCLINCIFSVCILRSQHCKQYKDSINSVSIQLAFIFFLAPCNWFLPLFERESTGSMTLQVRMCDSLKLPGEDPFLIVS